MAMLACVSLSAATMRSASFSAVGIVEHDNGHAEAHGIEGGGHARRHVGRVEAGVEGIKNHIADQAMRAGEPQGIAEWTTWKRSSQDWRQDVPGQADKHARAIQRRSPAQGQARACSTGVLFRNIFPSGL
ncbi:hypothetical protein ACU4HD_43425 [Cupriavidus basilensis]